MTLILARASKDYVLQVTDRLVTRGNEPFDTLANKNILYAAKNAVVAMAYTGQAFIGDVPTDQWIVETLSGRIFDRDRKPPFLSYVKTKVSDLGASIIRLKRSLECAPIAPKWQQAWLSSSFDLFINGWQWSRHGFRPVIASLSKEAGTSIFELEYAERYWFCERVPFETGPRRTFKFNVGAAPSANISRKELEEIVARLQGRNPDESEMVLAEAIRGISRKVPEVGPHCLSILVMPPSTRYIRVRYLPEHGPATAVLSTSSGSTFKLAVAFSPWLLGPDMIMAPSVFSGESQVGFGRYVVVLEAPPAPCLPQIMSGQRRPGAP
jgi:hypothetical protein